MKEAVLEELRRHFRPEFLNRVDETIVFHALTEEDLRQIAAIQLEGLRRRLMERRISLDLTAAAVTLLVRTGFDPNYGARPLKRTIQKMIETPLARLLVAGSVRDGQTVSVDVDPATNGMVFTPHQGSAAASAPGR
jgi:ATP-dependent Clp protease ATP-binding subunit ClpB